MIKKTLRRRLSSKRSHLLLLAILFVFTGALVLAIVTNDDTNKSADSQKNEQTEPAEPEPPEPKKFESKKFGFAFTYPGDWEQFELSDTRTVLANYDYSKDNRDTSQGEQKFITNVFQNPYRLSVGGFLNQEVIKDFKLENRRKTKLGGRNAIMVDRRQDGRHDTGLYIHRGGRIILLAWNGGAAEAARDIIGSLKLTEPTAQPVPDKRTPEPAPQQPQPPQNTSQFKTFSGVGFKQLYYSINLPGTVNIATPPAITGHTAADKRIRNLATNRGYQLQATPSVGLGSADGYALQTAAANAWAQLKQSAAADGISLGIISGYRSVSNQRSIFLGRLNQYGYSNKQIANAAADGAINQILATSSIPGYSKHHTGHVIDIQTIGTSFEAFGSTSGFARISANNYYNAKRFGFIPSYPSGVGAQGPNPEPREYVYVGTGYLKN